MSPKAFQECIAGDSNMTRIQILCEKVIHELVTGGTKIYDALSEYFLERSEAYKCMHQRFTAFCSNNHSTCSTDDYSELLFLREKVKGLTEELLHSSADLQSDVIVFPDQHTETMAENEDHVMHDTIRSVEKHEMESATEHSLLKGPQLASYRQGIKLSPKKEGEDVLELDLTIVQEEREVAVESGSKSFEEVELVEDDEGKRTENENSHANVRELIDSDGGGPSTSGHFSQGRGKTLHPCEHCGKTFAKKSNLSQHVRIHTGEKPFVCEHCGKKFRGGSGLVKHVRLHTGDRPFACQICGKRYIQTCNLVKHIRIHTGEKPFACEHCGKKFGGKGDLVRHVRIHTDKKPLVSEHARKKCRPKTALLNRVLTEPSAVTLRKSVRTGSSLVRKKSHSS